MNPHTQPKHTRRIPSADFPLSLPLLLAGATRQGVFSGEVHALQLTQRQGLISYLSHLQSQDRVLFPHTPSPLPLTQEKFVLSSLRGCGAFCSSGDPLKSASPLLPPSLQGMDPLQAKSASDRAVAQSGSGTPCSPGALEGKQHPSACSELCCHPGCSQLPFHSR